MAYGTLLYEFGGRGSLGFNWTQSQDDSNGLVERTYLRQDFPYTRLVEKIGRGTSPLAWSSLGLMQNSYRCTDSTGGSCAVAPGKSYFPYVNQVEEQAWDLNGAELPRKRTNTTVNAYGFPTQATVEWLTAQGSATDYKTTTTLTYGDDPASWLLGRVVKSTVVSSAPDVPAVMAPGSGNLPPTPPPSPAIQQWMTPILMLLLDD